MNKVLPSVALLAALSLAACSPQTTPPVTPAAPQGRVVYGLTSGGQLARFGADNAAASLTTKPITGLGSGETLADLDFNTNGGLLTGLTTNGKLYSINTDSGAATFTVMAAAPGVGTPQVIDFNPAAQRLRVLSAGDINYRLTPATTPATAGTVTLDGPLSYTAGDTNVGKNPNLVAAAYTNSFKDFKPEASATTLYSVDADLDTLVKHTSAANAAGTFSLLNTVGKLGIDVDGNTGFDIYGLNEGYLSASSNGATKLYLLNLTTGAATLKTTIPGLTLKSVALSLPPAPVPAAPQGRVIYGLTSGGQLARFGAENAAASLTTKPITGLGSGETLADLDFNTNGGLLTGLTTNGKLYSINTDSGAATFTVTALAPGVGTPQVIDFNPAAQRLRVFSSGDINYRVTPATTAATAGTVTSDGSLTFSLVDANVGKNPNLVAAAYTNSFKDFKPDASATTLYSVDADLDTLVKHTSAAVPAPAGNFSVLNTVGPLGVDATGNTGLDIIGLDEAYLSVSSAASTTLYTLNLTTGAAALKTTIPGLVLRSVAAALPTK